MNRKYAILMLAAGVFFLLVAGGLYIAFGSRLSGPSGFQLLPPTATPTPLPLPEIELTPPPSLQELAEQYPGLAPLLNDPELDSAYKDFLVAYQEGGESAALELARKRGLLTPDGQEIRVTLVLDTRDSAALVEQLSATGVTVVSAYEDQVNLSIPVSLVQAQLQSDQPGAIFSQLTELQHVIAVRLPAQRIPDGRAPDRGPITGEGVGVIGADSWHQAGYTGEGIRVGILDLGFSGYEELEGEELPANVTVKQFGWVDEKEVHGAACAEIVHEIAPDAKLYLAWYDGSDASMGEAIDWLLENDVRIISHSASSLIGPRDDTSPDAQRVDEIAARGILWVNSAGNQGTAHYRARFTDEDGDGYHEFAPGVEILELDPYAPFSVYLNWGDDWEEPVQDFDLFLVDDQGDTQLSSENLQDGQSGQMPAEWVSYETRDRIFVSIRDANQGHPDTMLDLFTHGADIDAAYNMPDHSLCPPADAVGSLTVGAVEWKNDDLAPYSSQGPTEDDRLKPDISAPAGVSGATYGRRGFDGTSASTPHVAGAAALLLQANPELEREQVTEQLLASAKDLGPDGPDTGYGFGRLQLPRPPAGEPATPIAWSPEETAEPLPTPSPVAYTTPEPGEPLAGPGDDTLLILLAVIGVGCCGATLLGAGGIILLVLTLRRRRPAQRPTQAPPSAPATAPAPRTCPHCGNPLPPSAQFCGRCGKPTVTAPPPQCRHCGAVLRPGARFCPKCGRPTQ